MGGRAQRDYGHALAMGSGLVETPISDIDTRSWEQVGRAHG